MNFLFLLNLTLSLLWFGNHKDYSFELDKDYMLYQINDSNINIRCMLRFDDETNFSLTICNQCNGVYELSKDKIAFNLDFCTKMNCDKELNMLEKKLIQHLQNEDFTFKINQSTLQLILKNGDSFQFK